MIKDQAPVNKYSYLGMSMAVGDFLGRGASVFAGGAPRSNGTGQVVLYKKNTGQNLFETRAIISGEQFASSFGYSMTALDADGDGVADLVVGAPFFYSKGEGGAVYQYLGKDMKLGKFAASLRLTGKLESRFGFALANASDLNQDRYDDLAVGAPYQGNGVVYIYLGGAKGLKSEPSQVIEASELPSPLNVLRTFGYSLSGSIDLDRNTYPDLLIGAYDSDAVVLLRSRPIIKIRTSVAGHQTIINPDVVGCDDDRNSKVACFSVQPCFQLIGNSQRGGRSFTGNSLRYKIEAETFTGKKYYRVTFREPTDSDRPNIVDRTVKLMNGYNDRYCRKEVIYLKSKSDIQNSIPFKLTYSLQQEEPRLPSQGDKLPNIDDYPILDQEEAQRIFYARFNKECGSDDICDSNLMLSAHISGAKKVEASNYTLVLRDDNINLNVVVSNNAEPAYDTNVIIEHSPSLSYVRREAPERGGGVQVDCVPDTRTQLRCTLPNPFKASKADFTIKFSALNIQDFEREFFIKVKANTTSRDKSSYDNEVLLYTEVARNAELELLGVSEDPSVGFSGVVKGEYAMVSVTLRCKQTNVDVDIANIHRDSKTKSATRWCTSISSRITDRGGRRRWWCRFSGRSRRTLAGRRASGCCTSPTSRR